MAWFQKKSQPDSSAQSPKTNPPVRVGKGLKISSLLSPQTVIFPPDGLDKTAVLQALATAVCATAGISDSAGLLNKVMEREQGISTTLDTGLSLPHARLDGIGGILAGMAILKKPIPDPKQADLPIRVMFLFFSPNKPEAFPLHLQLLRGVASLFQPALIERLTAAETPAAAFEQIKQLEA